MLVARPHSTGNSCRAAGVAHERRNPLSSIKGFATYFKERYRDVPEDQQTAGIMIKEVDRLNRVVSHLLEFARPIAVSKKPTPIKRLIEESLKLIKQQADEKNIAIDTDLADATAPIEMDPDRINQVLLNILVNAAQAIESQRRSDRGMIRIKTYADPESLYCEISDDGPSLFLASLDGSRRHEQITGQSAAEVSQKLKDGKPSILVGFMYLHRGMITISSISMNEEIASILSDRLYSVLA